MKRLSWALVVSVALLTAQGCSCGSNPAVDGGTGGNGGGQTGGGSGGGGSGGGGSGGGGSGGGSGGGTGGGAMGGGAGGSAGGGSGGGTGGGATAQLPPAQDVISGSGRVTGGNFVMDAQLGQGAPQAPANGGGRVIEGNTAIKR